jgi:hypothetical protein
MTCTRPEAFWADSLLLLLVHAIALPLMSSLFLLLLLLLQVRFSGDQGSITAMMSAEGEVVDLAASVKVRHRAQKVAQ